jgi:hypothetical protein
MRSIAAVPVLNGFSGWVFKGIFEELKLPAASCGESSTVRKFAIFRFARFCGSTPTEERLPQKKQSSRNGKKSGRLD